MSLRLEGKANKPNPTLSMEPSLVAALREMIGQVVKDGDQKSRPTPVANIVRHEGAISVPPGMSLEEAQEVLYRQMQLEETEVSVSHMIRATPPEGALAFQKALAQIYGWVTPVPTPTFFGPRPPKMIAVSTGPGVTMNVAWGRIELPGIEGYLMTEADGDQDGSDQMFFYIRGVVKRKHEAAVDAIAQLTREICAKESIYQGKAISLTIDERDGPYGETEVPIIRFIDVAPVEMVFSDGLAEQVQTNIWNLIERTNDARSVGVPRKRGVLAEGPYGTGKTLLAAATAWKATQNGWTFILTDAHTLVQAIHFARLHEPAVIFCEDIDRVTNERTESMNEILNTIDGIESKTSEIMVVLTTNHVEDIHKAMLRSGRIDAVISLRAPDAAAAERLVRLYAGPLIDRDDNLFGVGAALDGRIPAMIREVVERSKLAALSHTQPGEPFRIQAQDIITAADGMEMHMRLLESPQRENVPANVQLARSIMALAQVLAQKEGIPVPQGLNGLTSGRDIREPRPITATEILALS